MIRVAQVRPGSIGQDLGIEPGTWLHSINGEELRDALDLQFHEAEENVSLEARTPAGESVVYEIEKAYDDALGLIPDPDKVRRCTNACPFCFVKGNPKADKLRPGLYIKDDDYRLSFMYGHYVTLTNLRDHDWERIVAQRLSPLYVSVHAMDPAVRLEMLKNPRSAAIRDDLDRLAEGGIRVHAQVVLCPELNDGDVLAGTMSELYERGDAILSLSIVPVGLTRHNADRGIRPLRRHECVRALDQIDAVRARAALERGRGWCYAADELFLQAGREIPGREYYDDHELAGNGVGAMSELTGRVRADLDRLPELSGERIALVTGTSMRPQLERLALEIAAACGARVEVAAAENTLYGPMVTCAGLLPGEDHRSALDPFRGFDRAIISRTALNDDELFLDDMSLSDLRAAFPELPVWPSNHVTDALIPA